MAYGNYAPFYRPGYFNPIQTTAMPNIGENQNMQGGQPFGQPYQQPITLNQPSGTIHPMDERVWVNGEVGARAHLLAPNVTLPLWDSDANYLYLKSSDSTGKMSMVKYRLVEEGGGTANQPSDSNSEHTCTCGKEFVKIEEFNKLKAKYENLEDIVKTLSEGFDQKEKMS